MEIIESNLKGLYIITPKVWQDSRGYFFESYHQEKYHSQGITATFCQDNEAFSTYGVIRGLHYQTGKSAQGKLVRVLSGEVIDIVVDIRKHSSTYGRSLSLIMNDINKKQMYIPPGFAHGYAVLSESAVFSYKCTAFYDPKSEGGIHPLDPNLALDWIIPKKDMVISDKDENLPYLGKHKIN